ncbi:MAG: hypothetical protein WCP28_19045 [Actinomycetes bacterium]
MTHWGFVIEKWLWQLFEQRYHFTLLPMGRERFYMGAVVYPLVLSFDEAQRNMSERDRDLYEWFTAGLSEFAAD